MRVLVACEMSGRVREAFKKKGHEAYSCDILPALDGSKDHFQMDIERLLNHSLEDCKYWDLMIAFPPCTDLAVSGAKWFKQKQADGRQQASIEFFMKLANANIPKIAIENPIGIMSRIWRKPNQIIQPWQFGHPESKATCLWLKDLPLLVPSKILAKPASGRWENQTPSGQNKLGPSPERAMIRSITYQGIADAMAEQWG